MVMCMYIVHSILYTNTTSETFLIGNFIFLHLLAVYQSSNVRTLADVWINGGLTQARSSPHCYREDTDENSCSSYPSQTLGIGSTSNAQIYIVTGRILMRIAAPAIPPRHWV
jgi:hypothetical protein